MLWFKHLCDSSEDETLSALRAEFGAEGYGVWWSILETIAKLMDHTDRCHARYPVKEWAHWAGVSSGKFQKIVKFLQNSAEISGKSEKFSAEFDGKYLTIRIPNLLKIKDEYSTKLGRKSGHCPDKIASDKEEDTEIEEEYKESPLPPCDSGDLFPSNEGAPDTPTKADREEPAAGSDLETLRERWNAAAGPLGLPKVAKWGDPKGERRKLARARLKDSWWKENYHAALERLPRLTPFYFGQNDTEWKANMTWFVRSDTVAKLLEGEGQVAGITQAGANGQNPFRGGKPCN